MDSTISIYANVLWNMTPCSLVDRHIIAASMRTSHIEKYF